jgi:capsular exopolysaccharide synthesis family protein
MIFRRPKTAPDSNREQIDLTDLVRIMYRRRRLLVAVVVLGTGLSALASYLLPPYYVAGAILGLEGSDPKVFDVEAVLENKPQDRPTIATHVEFLTSAAFMREMVAQLELHKDPEFADVTPWPMKLVAAAAAWLPSSWPISVSLANSVAPPPLTEDILREVAVDQMLQKTRVQQVNDAYVVSVNTGSYDAQKAARIANAIAHAYVDKQYEFKRHATARAADWLNERVTDLREQLARADHAVVAYKQQTGFIEGNQDSPILRQMDQFSAQLVVAQSGRAQAEARLAQIEALQRSGQGLNGAAKVVTSPLLVQLRQEAGQLNRQVADLSKEYGARHPQIIGLLASLDDVRRREGDEVQRIISDLENNVTVARQLEGQLRFEIDKLSNTATIQEDVAVPLRQLEREASATDTLYKAFLSRAKELEEQLQIVDGGVEIVSEAATPLRPSFPIPILFIGAGFIGSSVLGVLAAFTAELFDTGMRTGHQLQRITGLPALALIPKIRVRRKDELFPVRLLEDGQSLYAEAVRAVRLELLFSNVDRPPRTVLITSALPGEGKTTLSISLAASAAQHGQRAILVDLDLHRPRLRRLVKASKSQPDLIDHLIGRAGLGDVIIADRKDPNLSFITVGRIPANPSALLGSQKMMALLQELQQHYDFIVLDLPPVLAVNDARVIAGQVDAVLFVVQWGKTKEEAARAGIELLHERNIPLVGAVLNQVDIRRHAKGAYGDALQYYRKYRPYYNRIA